MYLVLPSFFKTKSSQKCPWEIRPMFFQVNQIGFLFNFTGFYWVLLGFTGFTRFYLCSSKSIQLVFRSILPSFTEFFSTFKHLQHYTIGVPWRLWFLPSFTELFCLSSQENVAEPLPFNVSETNKMTNKKDTKRLKKTNKQTKHDRVFGYTGHPLPEYRWLKDGAYLGDFSPEPVLKIQSIQRRDAGVYQCVARNSVGSIFSEKVQIVVACESLHSLTGFLLGFTVFYRVLPPCYWALHSFTGFYRVLLGFTGFYWVLPRCYWATHSFTVFYRVLPRCYWALHSFTGFYWVLLGFTGFYLDVTGQDIVLLGFTGFY